MRDYLHKLAEYITIVLIVLVLDNIGFDVIANAAMDVFPSLGGLIVFIVFVVAMAALSGVVFAKKRKKP